MLDISCIAVPVRDTKRRMVAAMSTTLSAHPPQHLNNGILLVCRLRGTITFFASFCGRLGAAPVANSKKCSVLTQ
jgi:hypothetical protein